MGNGRSSACVRAIGMRAALTRVLELLRARIEQQLQASSGLSNADYTVLAVLSEAPEGRPPMKFSQSSRTGPHRRSNAAARRSERSSRSPW
jgi:hypothetical protein